MKELHTQKGRKMNYIFLILLVIFLLHLQVGQVYGWAAVPTHPELTEEAFDTLGQSGACTFSPHYKFIAVTLSMQPDNLLRGDTDHDFYAHWYNPDLPPDDGTPPPENGGAIIRSRECHEVNG